VHERIHNVLEDDPVGDAAAVTSQRMAGIEVRPVR
jgi:hypothetical protein